MKETSTQVKEEIKNVRQVEIPKQLEFVGSLRPQKGHTLFEFNYKTGEIKAAEFKIDAVNFTDAKIGAISHRRKVIKKPDCTYVAALNIKNAFKRLGIRVNIIKDKKI